MSDLNVDAVKMTLLDLHREYPEPETLARLPLSGDDRSPPY